MARGHALRVEWWALGVAVLLAGSAPLLAAGQQERCVLAPALRAHFCGMPACARVCARWLGACVRALVRACVRALVLGASVAPPLARSPLKGQGAPELETTEVFVSAYLDRLLHGAYRGGVEGRREGGVRWAHTARARPPPLRLPAAPPCAWGAAPALLPPSAVNSTVCAPRAVDDAKYRHELSMVRVVLRCGFAEGARLDLERSWRRETRSHGCVSNPTPPPPCSTFTSPGWTPRWKTRF